MFVGDILELGVVAGVTVDGGDGVWAVVAEIEGEGLTVELGWLVPERLGEGEGDLVIEEQLVAERDTVSEKVGVACVVADTLWLWVDFAE